MTGPRKTTKSNPFCLTDSECDVMDLLVKYGTAKEAADHLGRTHKSINNVVRSCVKKMGCRNDIHAVLKWDRMRRTETHLEQIRKAMPANSVFSIGAVA